MDPTNLTPASTLVSPLRIDAPPQIEDHATTSAQHRHSLFAATLADADAVHRKADALRQLEKRLEELRNPQPAVAQAPTLTQAEHHQAIRRLEARREEQVLAGAGLLEQCAHARQAIERVDALLRQDTEELERLDRAKDAEPPSAPMPEIALIDALSAQIRGYESMRDQAVKHADEVSERSALRGLAEQASIRVTPDLNDAMTVWLRHQQAPRMERQRQPPPSRRQFQSMVQETSQKIDASAASPGQNAQDALLSFLSLTSSCGVRELTSEIEKLIAHDLARNLILANTEQQTGMSRQALSAPYRWLGISPAQRTRKMIQARLDDTLFRLGRARQAGITSVQMGEQNLNAQEASRALERCEALKTLVESRHQAFEAVVTSTEDAFVESMAVDDIEKLGQSFGPQAHAHFSKLIDAANAERTALRLMLRTKTDTARVETERVEKQMQRLHRDLSKHAEANRSQFELYAGLSAQHIESSEEIEAIDGELQQHRHAIQSARQEWRQLIQQRTMQGTQAVQLEKLISEEWQSALESPELSRLISPTALNRTIRLHLDQTVDQMHARVKRLARTGTFSSPSGLLRVIAEVAQHELGKPSTALLADTPAQFQAMVASYPSGRMDALCHHARTVGHGVRNSSRGPEQARTGTSQYSLDWVEWEGVRITHLHPWISPY